MNSWCDENCTFFLFLLEIGDRNQINTVTCNKKCYTSWCNRDISPFHIRTSFSFMKQELFKHRVCIRKAIGKVGIVFRTTISVRKSQSIIILIILFIPNVNICLPIFNVSTSSTPSVPIWFAGITNFHSILKNRVPFNKIEYMKSDLSWQFINGFKEEPLSTFWCVHISRADKIISRFCALSIYWSKA